MAKKKCYLRKTEVKLADGEKYTFRALPFNTKTARLLEGLFNEGEDTVKLVGLAEAIELSLSFDQDAETVEYLMNSGLIPFGNTEGEDGETFQKILGALVSQFQKEDE